MLSKEDSREFHPEESHRDILFRSMDNFRRQEILCDVVLIADGTRFPAHKNVLAAGSSYFLGLFTTDMKEQNETEVNFEDFKSSTMDELLCYIYTGEVNLTETNAKDLVFAADYLLVGGLKRKGSEFLEDTLTPGNCLSVRSFAETFDCPELQTKAECYILDNFVEVSRCEEFLSLDPVQLERLISCDGLVVDEETQVFEALLQWTKNDEEKRRASFPALLRCIRLPFISKYYIVENMETEPLIRDSLDCMRLVYQVMKHFAFRSQLSEDATTYDPATNKWQEVAPLSVSRGGPCVIAHKYVYAIGGKTEHGSEAEIGVYMKTAERFDARANTWTEIPAMQTRRAYAGGVAMNDRLYVIGGTQDDLLSAHNTCEVFDCLSETWGFIASLVIPRALGGVAYLNGRIYVLGGKKNCRERTDKMEMYDLELNEWTVMGTVPNCIGGIQCCAVSLNRDLVNSLQSITRNVP
ncbi:predicted protein [Nematostella vectensis]|uniref:BTB domain-containing protein n=1 Tax=Nematostella vectensis TaxID=45351 RepID=A7RXT2_NEMVE|nr:predicted protein [Nematostella vectensis]|eukprot:XP_001635779.1 predicted protein [Nematostella vectensis]